MVASSRPALLVITTRFPYPPIGGEKLRIFTIIEHLAADFDVDVFAFYSDDRELSGLARLREICRDVQVFRLGTPAKMRNTMIGWLRGLPLQVAHYYSKRAQRTVDRLIADRGYDAVLAHLVRTAEYTRGVPAEHVVLELTDAISMNYYRITRPRTGMELLYLLERRRLLGYEAAATRRVGRCVVVAETDRRFLADHGADAAIEVITNGTEVQPRPDVVVQPQTIAFLGNLRSAPNEDMVLRFAADIFPLVLAERPDARFLVIGANPSAAVRRLHDGRRIIVTGEVPDPADLLAGARVSVCPMRFGAGVQNKVLESMALGVPVVATPAGHEGIPAQAGEEILVAADDDSFARQVLAVLADDDLRDGLSAAGQEFIERSFRWNGPMADYRAVVLECAASAGKPT